MLLSHLRLLVDPVELGGLPALDLGLLEPEIDLLLGVVDAVAAVAHVAADVLQMISCCPVWYLKGSVVGGEPYKSEVTTDGARGGGKGVSGTEDSTAGLDGITAFPDHGADWARAHI